MTQIPTPTPNKQSLRIATLLGALQDLELDPALRPSHPGLVDMTLTELIAALLQKGINVTLPMPEPNSEDHASKGLNTEALEGVDAPVTQEYGHFVEAFETANSQKAQALTAAENTTRGSKARREAIEQAFQTHAGISLERRPLNPSPDISRVDDFSDLVDADLSSFAPSEVDTTEAEATSPVDTVASTFAGGDGNGNLDLFSPRMVFNCDGSVKAVICGRANCKAYNPIDTNGGSAAQPWYAIVKRKQIGVFQGWDVVGPLVNGVSHANFTKKSSEQEARDVFEKAVLAGTAEVRPF